MQDQQVKNVIFQDEARHLALVQYEDATIGIRLDNQPVAGHQWQTPELNAAVNAYRRLAAEPAHPPFQRG